MTKTCTVFVTLLGPWSPSLKAPSAIGTLISSFVCYMTVVTLKTFIWLDLLVNPAGSESKLIDVALHASPAARTSVYPNVSRR